MDPEPIFEKQKRVLKDYKEIPEKKVENCIYCKSRKIVKRGKRNKKYEEVQLYLCKDCKKTFTGQKVKGKTFPLKIILDGLSFYNQGYSMEQSCVFLKENYGVSVKPFTLSRWLKEFGNICSYLRMREFGKKLFNANQTIYSANFYHRQVFRFYYHKAKTALLLQEFKHRRFEPLREFLEYISVECPHQYFKEGLRASEVKTKFDLSQVIINEKNNFAVRIANLVLQAVKNNKKRHEMLQRFMLLNDSVTIATEIPIYMDDEDLAHLKEELNFKIPLDFGESRVITGHIDLIQIRNGSVYILDYKPNAKREKPIEQLTIYALALSRLTGLRIYDFKCGWFDNKNYYEFFPLHVIYKRGRKRKISREQTTLKTG
jgi:transposase-like protein